MLDRIKQYWDTVENILIDDTRRTKLQFVWIYRILCVVSLSMTAINVFSEKYLLMCATLLFSILCVVNILLSKGGERSMEASTWLFSTEIIVLFIFFIISGTPEGFSAIWICMLPASGLFLYGWKRGTLLAVIMLLIVAFFFHSPLGISCSQYEYTDSFRLRFPLLYIAFYAVSFFLEMVRASTQKQLIDTQKKYEYLYRHDALTGIINRYGFNELMAERLKNPAEHTVTLFILDLDHFKRINDRFGHANGDKVLKRITEYLSQKVGEMADVCRWGGEEFAILLTSDSDAKRFADDLVTGVSNIVFDLEDSKIQITVSVGAVSAPPHTRIDSVRFLSQTDRCLYKAKDAGRNCSICEAYADVAGTEPE